MALRLLAHVTYYDASVTAGVDSKTAAVKTSAAWREFNYHAVVRLLDEMECSYDAFSHVAAVVDVNEGHSFQERLQSWRGGACGGSGAGRGGDAGASSISASSAASSSPSSSSATASARPGRVRSVSVVAHKLTHPFRLAWAHREHMVASLESYDWFLSVEGDTLVPGRAMAAQVALAPRLYERHNMLLGFTRVVNDTLGNCFYSDIVKPAASSTIVALDGLGRFVTPTNTYAAVWAYPRDIMRAFVKSADWQPVLKTVRGMRERAAWGWRHGRIVTLVDESALRIYHLGKSGQYHVKQRGHNAWPVEKLVAR